MDKNDIFAIVLNLYTIYRDIYIYIYIFYKNVKLLLTIIRTHGILQAKLCTV